MIDTLVISIGGIKGIAFIGVIKELFKKVSQNKITKYIGSSVGSIISVLLTIGYNPDEIYSICTEIDFSKFTLNVCDKLHECFENEICSLDNLNNFGLDNCNGLIRLLKSIIQIKCNNNITFEEHFKLFNKELTIVATNIDELKPTYFNYKLTPDTKIIDAVKFSISIPIIYTMQNCDNVNYVDGGISNYYPINYYNPETSIGICLVKNNSVKRENTQILNYILNLVNSLEIYLHTLLNKLYSDYTIFIDIEQLDTNLSGLRFDLNCENKKKLYNFGKSQFINYYQTHKNRFES